MSDDRGFLNAISAKPDDLALRLIYADWLEERGDFRSEFVRLQVRLAGLKPDEPEFQPLTAREQELRGICPARWTAILDPAVWCVVGNIVDEHPSGPGGEELRRGTRLFRPNAKIYLANTRNCYGLVGGNPGQLDSIQVIGQHRKARKWLQSWVRLHYTTDWRVRPVRDPGVILRLRKADWPGFHLRQGEFVCPENRQSEEAILALLDVVQMAGRRNWEQQRHVGE